mgnify:FL=1
MPRIKTKPKLTTKNNETTVSPGIISEMRSFCYVRKEENYEDIT